MSTDLIDEIEDAPVVDSGRAKHYQGKLAKKDGGQTFKFKVITAKKHAKPIGEVTVSNVIDESEGLRIIYLREKVNPNYYNAVKIS